MNYNLSNNYKKIYEKVFFITLAYLGLIDSLNGFFMQKSGVSISIVYRMIVLLIFTFFTLYKNDKKNYISIVIIIIYLIISSSFSLINNGYESKIISEFIKISKLIFIFTIIESYKNIYKNDYTNGLSLIEKIVDYNLIIFPLCILIPMILGIGINTYDSSIGSKGFFYANNEIGLILSVLCIFATDRLYNKVNIYNTFIVIIVFISTISIGSKVGLLVPLIVLSIYFIKSIFNKKEKEGFYKLMIGSIVIMALIIIIFFGKLIFAVIERQIHFYKIYNSSQENPILTLILSGRNNFINIIHKALMTSKSSIMIFLFGYSSFIKDSIIGLNFYGVKSLKAIEMDFFDILYGYGLIGVVLIYGYFLKYIIKYKSFKSDSLKYTLSFIVIIILGFLAGHVFFGAMAGSMLAIVICGMISSYEDNIYEVDIIYQNMIICTVDSKKFEIKTGCKIDEIIINNEF